MSLRAIKQMPAQSSAAEAHGQFFGVHIQGWASSPCRHSSLLLLFLSILLLLIVLHYADIVAFSQSASLCLGRPFADLWVYFISTNNSLRDATINNI